MPLFMVKKEVFEWIISKQKTLNSEREKPRKVMKQFSNAEEGLREEGLPFLVVIKTSTCQNPRVASTPASTNY